MGRILIKNVKNVILLAKNVMGRLHKTAHYVHQQNFCKRNSAFKPALIPISQMIQIHVNNVLLVV